MLNALRGYISNFRLPVVISSSFYIDIDSLDDFLSINIEGGRVIVKRHFRHINDRPLRFLANKKTLPKPYSYKFHQTPKTNLQKSFRSKLRNFHFNSKILSEYPITNSSIVFHVDFLVRWSMTILNSHIILSLILHNCLRGWYATFIVFFWSNHYVLPKIQLLIRSAVSPFHRNFLSYNILLCGGQFEIHPDQKMGTVI